MSSMSANDEVKQGKKGERYLWMSQFYFIKTDLEQQLARSSVLLSAKITTP